MTQMSVATIRKITEPSEMISAITESLHQMSPERLKTVFNFVQSLDYRAASQNELNAEHSGIHSENSLKAEWDQLRDSLRDHPFARMDREEVLAKLRQTREEVYDELYGEMYEN